MASTEVEVIAIQGSELIVTGKRSGGCSACASRDACGGQDSLLNVPHQFSLSVPYHPEQLGSVQPGQRLQLSCDEGPLLRAIWIVFGLPLLGLVLAPLLLMLFSQSDPIPTDGAILASAVLGTALGLSVSRWLAKRLPTSQPSLTNNSD